MTTEEIREKLDSAGIDTKDIIIEPSKKSYPKDGKLIVGMYSRELKKDFWFWDKDSNILFVLEACWKDRKKYPLVMYPEGKKYEVPLTDFQTYLSYINKMIKVTMEGGNVPRQIYRKGVKGVKMVTPHVHIPTDVHISETLSHQFPMGWEVPLTTVPQPPKQDAPLAGRFERFTTTEPTPVQDEPWTHLTIRDIYAMLSGRGVSNKEWLNKLIDEGNNGI